MKLFTPAAVGILAVLQTALVGSVTAGGLEGRATVCNGHADLCEKSFGAVTFVGAHDSYAIGTGCELLPILFLFCIMNTD